MNIFNEFVESITLETIVSVSNNILAISILVGGAFKTFTQRRARSKKQKREVMDNIAESLNNAESDLKIERSIIDYIPYNFEIKAVRHLLNQENPLQRLDDYRRLCPHIKYKEGNGFLFNGCISSFFYKNTNIKSFLIISATIICLLALCITVYTFIPISALAFGEENIAKGATVLILLSILTISLSFFIKIFSQWHLMLISSKRLNVKSPEVNEQ